MRWGFCLVSLDCDLEITTEKGRILFQFLFVIV